MSVGISELSIIAVIACVFVLIVVGGGGLTVWLVTRKGRQDES